MRSDIPKPLHLLNHKPLIYYILDAVQAISPATTYIIIGHQADEVKRATAAYKPGYSYQPEQLGTGDAVKRALDRQMPNNSTILVLPGDCPLIQPETLQAMIQTHQTAQADATVMTAIIPPPHAYGRIIRSASGDIIAIRETRDATESEREIAEINTGFYCFKIKALRESLAAMRPVNAQGEYYLTDSIAYLNASGYRLTTHRIKTTYEAMGVNTPEELAKLETYLKNSSKST